VEAFIKLITPLFDARLVLAIVIVVCATWALLGNKLDGTQWAVAVGGTIWWSTRKDETSTTTATTPTEQLRSLR